MCRACRYRGAHSHTSYHTRPKLDALLGRDPETELPRELGGCERVNDSSQKHLSTAHYPQHIHSTV